MVWREFVNGNKRAMRVKIESGTYGATLFDLPPGARFRISGGSRVPRVLIDDVPVGSLEGNNVVKIDDHKPLDP